MSWYTPRVPHKLMLQYARGNKIVVVAALKHVELVSG